MSGSRKLFWNKFHVVGPTTAKVRRPYVSSWNRGTTSRWRLAERRCCRSATWATGVLYTAQTDNPVPGHASRVFFRIWNMGGVNQPLGVPSLPFSSPFPFAPPSPSPLSLISPFSRGVLCESWGVLTPPPEGGVGNSLHASTCTPSPQACMWLDLPHRRSIYRDPYELYIMLPGFGIGSLN